MPKLIPLTRGKHAIVDAKYYDALIAIGKWCYDAEGYARHGSQRMHTVVMRLAGVTGFKQVDHRDLNGLNNRRRNLRPATKQQNMRNRGPQRNNTSGFKGVYLGGRARSRWCAQIKIDGRMYHLGCFNNAVQAAHAYDRAARKHFGRFAFLNFPRMSP